MKFSLDTWLTLLIVILLAIDVYFEYLIIMNTSKEH